MMYRFSGFELDPATGDLSGHGGRVRLPQQPLEVLLRLLARPGQLVNRSELEQTLWPDGTVVDYEVGINNAIRKLRHALALSADGHGLIETIPRRGYILRSPVEVAGGDAEPPSPLAAAPSIQRGLGRWRTAVAGGALMVATVWLASWLRPLPPARIVAITPVTTDGGLDLPAKPVSMGRDLYYLDRNGADWALMRARIGGGSAAVATPWTHVRLLDVSANPASGARWLLERFGQRGSEADLWIANHPDGTPTRVGDTRALDAAWFPDGEHIVYGSNHALWRVDSDGTGVQRLAALPDTPYWLVWSPDGRRLRFNAGNAIWEWSAGRPARVVFPQLHDPYCCGGWTAGGAYFLYSRFDNGIWNLWAQRQSGRLGWGAAPAAQPLTAGPASAYGAFTGAGDRTVVYYKTRVINQVQRLELPERRTTSVLAGHSATQLEYSRDARQLVYLDYASQTVWTAQVAGGAATALRQLTSPVEAAAWPRWSPDGRWIAFDSHTAAGPRRAYVVPAAGGARRQLLPQLDAAAAVLTPDWSPDGTELVVVLERRQGAGDVNTLARVDLARHRYTELPGSTGEAAPRWSPDGRHIAAFSSDQQRLSVLDLRTGAWRTIAIAKALSIPVWSRDGAYLYYQDLLAPGQPLYRVHGQGAPELVAEFSAELRNGYHRCGFLELAPDGAPLLDLTLGFANLEIARLELP